MVPGTLRMTSLFWHRLSSPMQKSRASSPWRRYLRNSRSAVSPTPAEGGSLTYFRSVRMPTNLLPALAPLESEPCEAARRGALAVLPLVLLVVYALVPAISARIFSTFFCSSFGEDDGSDRQRYFLHADLSVECFVDGYSALVAQAALLIVLWPIAVPAAFFALLYVSRRGVGQSTESLARAVSFLYAEYRDELYYWELLEQMRKLTLTGYLLLIPPKYDVFRLVCAILISIGHATLLLAARPYKDASNTVTALMLSVTIVFVLLSVLLVSIASGLPEDLAKEIFGFESAFPIAMTVLGVNLMVVAVVPLVVLFQLRVESRTQASRRLRFVLDSSEVAMAPPGHAASPDGDRYHLFLSHVWGTGQDQMRIVKQRLLEMVPSIKVSSKVPHSPYELSDRRLRCRHRCRPPCSPYHRLPRRRHRHCLPRLRSSSTSTTFGGRTTSSATWAARARCSPSARRATASRARACASCAARSRAARRSSPSSRPSPSAAA